MFESTILVDCPKVLCRLHAARRAQSNDSSIPKAAAYLIGRPPTQTGRVLPIAVACDSGIPCCLRETVIGQFATFDTLMQIADNRLALLECWTISIRLPALMDGLRPGGQAFCTLHAARIE